ncbi:MAG TPA: hypothetical protein VMV46_12870 [Thermoanaerobaculia bacterium]|nr:hypothetical protein [Thermoanaerobaculia bacterium]
MSTRGHDGLPGARSVRALRFRALQSRGGEPPGWLAACLVAFALAAACGGPAPEDDSSSASPAEPPAESPVETPAESAATEPPAERPVVARAAGATDGTAVEIHSLERGADGVVTLRFSIVNDQPAGERELGGYDFVDPRHEVRDFGSVGGVHLLDARSLTKFEVARDGNERCLCSRRIDGVTPGGRRYFWAKFAGVPAEVAAVSVVVPKFEPAEEVGITAAAPPSTTVAGAANGTALTVQELARGADGSITLRVEISNQGQRELGGYAFTHPDHEVADFATLGGVVLFDARTMTAFEVDRDADGKCICATDLQVALGRTARAWAKFTGLPADLGSVTVVVPQFDAVEEVAVQAPPG